jgi:hypothetical protein
MNSNLSNISGSPTRIIKDGNSYISGESLGGGNYPVFKSPMVERIVVLKEGTITELTEKYQEADGTTGTQSVLGNLSDVTGDLGQNIDGLDLPAGTILIPTRVAFNSVTSGTATLELHLLHKQAQTALKVS